MPLPGSPTRRSRRHFVRSTRRFARSSGPALDPNLRCAYSYWRVGQCTTIAGYERVAQGPIHFAGEHCSVDFQGSMEGAAVEGIRAAREVLAAIRHG